MIESVFATASRPEQVLVEVLIDEDDPELAHYRAVLEADRRFGRGLSLTVGRRTGYTATLNTAAARRWDLDGILGAFGDDVVFRTHGWDDRVDETLRKPGIAYGDDLIHGKNHPSAVFMSSVIARALGWFALPTTTHQWADDGWKKLGQATGLLRFMDGVVFEHEHPGVGKADWDDTYNSVFDSDRAKADHAGFTGWVESGGLDADAAKVRAVR